MSGVHVAQAAHGRRARIHDLGHQPARLETANLFDDVMEHFIDGEIQRARVDDAHLPVADEPVELTLIRAGRKMTLTLNNNR